MDVDNYGGFSHSTGGLCGYIDNYGVFCCWFFQTPHEDYVDVDNYGGFFSLHRRAMWM